MKRNLLFLLCLLQTVFSILAGQSGTAYGSLFTNTTFDNKTINLTLPTGSVAASVDVTPSGGASYTIPIAVPPGTNGVAPQISVSYFSQAGNGLLGNGWGISGLSVITRVPRSKYFDIETNGVDLTSNDRFALDGVRLIVKSGVYGANASTYGTESENFAKVTSKGSVGAGPQWFEVVLKDGTIMEYGNTTDARFLNASGTNVLIWKLNKIRYNDGNYIEYKYVTLDSDSHIDEINYTGNSVTGMLPYNKLKFNYSIRYEVTTAFEVQTPIKSKFLLDKITITAEASAAFKTYEFKYAKNNTTSFLIEVIEKGSNATALNSTIFKYGNEPAAFPAPSNSSVFAGQQVDVFSGDFDADGYTDIMAATRVLVNGKVTHTEFKIYKRTATSSTYAEVPTAATNINVPGKNSIVYGPRGGGHYTCMDGYNFMIGDFTGDGADDIAIARTNSDFSRLESIVLYQSNNGNTFTPVTLATFSTPNNKITNLDNFLKTGDFNGDGIMDMLVLLGNDYNSNQSLTLYNGGSTGGTGISNGTPQPYYLINSWAGMDRILVLDFNGDGKSDIMLTKDSFSEIVTISGFSTKSIYQGGFPTKWHLPFFGDFNGDRKTDMLLRTSTTNNLAAWKLAISTGSTFIESNFTFNHTPEISQVYTGDELLISDYNGDGKMDIGHGWANKNIYGNFDGTSRIDMYYSKGDNFFSEQYTYNGLWTTAVSGSADMNSDGRPDWVLRNGYTQPFYIFSFKKDGKELLLERVKNGVGHVSEFSYKPMTQTEGGSFYTRGSLTAQPLNNIQLPMLLVSESRMQNGIGGNTIVQYSYEEAKLHKEGKGLLGLKLFKSNNLATGQKSSLENEFNNTFYSPALYKTQVRLASNNSLLNEVTYTNEFVSLGSKRFWARTNSSVENKAFEGINVTSSNTYDTNGNVTSATISTGTQSTMQVTSTYGQFGTPIPAKLTSISTTTTRAGQSAYTVASTMAYNSLGQMTSKTDFSNLAQNIVTTYTYNNFGNPNAETVTPTGLTGRTKNYGYDAKGRFIVSESNPNGQSASATFDVKWGKPLTVTGIDGLTTSYSYDAFGRRTQTTLPTTAGISEIYGWDVNATDKTVHYHYVIKGGKPDSKVWYDVLDREVKNQTDAISSQYIYQKKTYNSRYNVATTTTPYKSGETILTTTYTYDTYDRVTSETNTLGTTSYAYAYNTGNLTTTVTNPAAQVSSTVIDATGKIISATDNGGTLNYTFNSQGNLTQVKIGSTTVLTTSIYDNYGRQTSLADIDAGTTQYGYNLWGEMTSQTNALGQTHTMTYDNLSRITQRVGPEGTTTYEYFLTGSGASVNKIKKVTGFAANLEEFTYDTYGRLATSKETIDATVNTTTYTYNIYNDVTSTEYPSGFKVNAAYDANGYLQTLKNGTNSVTMFTNTGMNGFNQYTNYTLGNTKTSQNTYYFGIPTRYFTSGVQNLNLTWNYASMNLGTRYDAIKNKTENFTYDNLNRLTGATVAGLSAQTVAYANNGNITSKTDAGPYTYSTSKIHAVIKTGNTILPSNTQNITYTAFFQPASVSEVNFTLDYTYASDYERIKSILKQNGSTINTRYYFGSYEKDITGASTKHIHYISAGQGLIAIVVRENGTDTYNYVYTDHLGSILTVTNSTGVVTEQQNFDAWGRNRNTTDWTYNNVQSVSGWLYRGYTGHEHLPQFGLVNMNGRLYDPLVGRMLSVDNYVQNSGLSTQGFNRYSYANGNPLKFTDPSGEALHLVIGAFVGAVGNVVVGAMRGEIKDGWDLLYYAGTGAAIGTLAAATGGASLAATGLTGGIAGGALAGATSGLVGGGLQGVTNATYQTVRYNAPSSNILRDGIQGAGYGMIGGAIIGGTIGGISAKFAKGPPRNIWTGVPKEGTFDVPVRIIDWGDGYYSPTGSSDRVVTSPKSLEVYRAVSLEEYQDIITNGFRPHPSGRSYETGKLFWNSYSEAVDFAKMYNQPIVVKTRIPASIPVTQTFGTDGVQYVNFVSTDYLHRLRLLTYFNIR